jgi:hypothetical protein
VSIVTPFFKPGVPILVAMSRGDLPANIQLSAINGVAVGAGMPNPTLLSLMSGGNADGATLGPHMIPNSLNPQVGQMYVPPAGAAYADSSVPQNALAGQTTGGQITLTAGPQYGGN